MTLLALETSCDETSAAVVREGRVLSNLVSSQIALHAEYGGVVPELAVRAHLRNLMPIARLALEQARVRSEDLDAVAATLGPGLPSALRVGANAGPSLAYVLRKPFVGLHHHEAHLYSPWIRPDPLRFRAEAIEPCVSLIVSGGHTLLVHVKREGVHAVLGSTTDDAAGECFDKVAKMLGLAYPGGPEIDRLAKQGNPRAYALPRPRLKEDSLDFSFSGLKTAARYFLRDHPEILDRKAALQDFCASVQDAIVEVLVAKTIRAARLSGVACVTASGGVTCNRRLRQELARACGETGLRLLLAEPALCTDNAVMVGVLAERKLLHGSVSRATFEVRPNWKLNEGNGTG